MKTIVRLSKSEMNYYRALKRGKASYDKLFKTADSGSWLASAVEDYDRICTRLEKLRVKGLIRRMPKLDPDRCPVVGPDYTQCTRPPHADPLKTGDYQDYHYFGLNRVLAIGVTT